ncbi:sel1 repeat family protein [Bradyrhizobium elkanii]|nr:sel1 repeat family protein [Bradyrhizobium elkanii]
MRNVGIEFENGVGRPADAAQAAQWYRKAADTGDPRCWRSSSRMLRHYS